MLHTISLLLFFASVSIGGVDSHEESGAWSCDSNSEIRLQADFKPGLITLDGHADDWKDIDGSDFSLLLAVDPDADKEYKGGKMTVKVLFIFLIQSDGIIYSQYTCMESSCVAYLLVNYLHQLFTMFSRHDCGVFQTLHDGRDIFFLLEADGVYAYSKG